MKQLSLFPNQLKSTTFMPTEGKRKSKRPLSTHHPIHMVLKSSKKNLKNHERELLRIWFRFANQFGIKTYKIVVNWDHIHVVLRVHSQKLYNHFIQAFSGTVAKVLSVRWLARPFTRLLNWGRDFKRIGQYLKLNWCEANGFLDYQPDRTRRLPGWLRL